MTPNPAAPAPTPQEVEAALEMAVRALRDAHPYEVLIPRKELNAAAALLDANASALANGPALAREVEALRTALEAIRDDKPKEGWAYGGETFFAVCERMRARAAAALLPPATEAGEEGE